MYFPVLKVHVSFQNCSFQRSFQNSNLQNLVVFKIRKIENFGLEDIIEFVDLVKRFPTRIWLQKSALIQTRTSLLKFEDSRFCRSQFRSHAALDVFFTVATDSVLRSHAEPLVPDVPQFQNRHRLVVAYENIMDTVSAHFVD